MTRLTFMVTARRAAAQDTAIPPASPLWSGNINSTSALRIPSALTTWQRSSSPTWTRILFPSFLVMKSMNSTKISFFLYSFSYTINRSSKLLCHCACRFLHQCPGLWLPSQTGQLPNPLEPKPRWVLGLLQMEIQIHGVAKQGMGMIETHNIFRLATWKLETDTSASASASWFCNPTKACQYQKWYYHCYDS